MNFDKKGGVQEYKDNGKSVTDLNNFPKSGEKIPAIFSRERFFYKMYTVIHCRLTI